MKALEARDCIKKLSFDNEQDRNIFQEEISSLLDEEKTSILVKKNTLEELRNLYISLSSSKSIFELSLASKNSSSSTFLKDFFLELIGDDIRLPSQGSAIEFLVNICARKLEKEYIIDLLKTDILSFYQLNHLQLLQQFYFDNLTVFIDFYTTYGKEHTDVHKKLVVEILHILYPTSLGENTAEDLDYFLREILPAFIQRFENHPDLNIYEHVERVTEWFMVWFRYYEKTEDKLVENDEYYEMDFKTIVKYIPEFIWWNNGLYYRNGDKNFYFGSLGFFHLAKGGSIRNAPDKHHFTRRMAKIFVNLPYHFDQTEKDMYIYCYGKALGAGGLLSDMLQQFVRHHAGNKDLEEELEKWNPIIQKLSCDEFEALDNGQAVEFMGYIYHCLRDKPDFTVQRRTMANLLRDSEAYNTRIRERAQQREAQRQAREREAEAYRKKKEGKWNPHKSVKPYGYEPYKIVELTNKHQLINEGLVMNHCVGSYEMACMKGHCSIWSLREFKKKSWFSLVTIELDRNNNIRQASARFNSTPHKDHMKIILSWAQENKVNAGRFGNN